MKCDAGSHKGVISCRRVCVRVRVGVGVGVGVGVKVLVAKHAHARQLISTNFFECNPEKYKPYQAGPEERRPIYGYEHVQADIWM